VREVKPDQQPDLIVRYWPNSQSTIVTGSLGAWDQLGNCVDYYWAESSWGATVMIDPIDLKRKDLAWRLYLAQKIGDDGRIWTRVLGEIPERFKSYACKKQIEKKKKRRADRPPNPAAQ
jgi:hypothetical protein